MKNKEDNLIKAKYIEWQASLFGACAIAVGLGVYFSELIKALVPLIILIGILLHGWGMYRIHQRNK